MRRDGFTLGELLVALVLTALVGGAAIETVRITHHSGHGLDARARRVADGVRNDAAVRWAFRHAVASPYAVLRGDQQRLTFFLTGQAGHPPCEVTFAAGVLTWCRSAVVASYRTGSPDARLRYLLVVDGEYRWLDRYESSTQLPRAIEIREQQARRLFRVGWGDGH